MGKTNIEWATHTVNFYDWACTSMSPGCDNCYARGLAYRYGKDFNKTPEWRDKAVREWQGLKDGSVVFINSMSDTFHEGVHLSTVIRLLEVVATRPKVTALILTKRIGRARREMANLAWPSNAWLGTSVENADYLWRANLLAGIPDLPGRFISAEPLLGDLLDDSFPAQVFAQHIQSRAIGWVITGAESGPNRRLFNPVWAAKLRDLCVRSDVRFMHKQGSDFKPGQNRLLEGRTWDESPFAEVHHE
jgi:protein gp37